MRCMAPVLAENAPSRSGYKTQDPARYRADGNTDDRRCRRHGHYAVPSHFGHWTWLCEPHSRIWLRHHEIVQKITAIPVRRDIH